MPHRITMSDVAQQAGVSLMTVSRVVNQKGDVSPQTRQRVLQTIEQLGYRPSGIARSLATQRTATLGLVMPDVTNPFFSDVARGVEHLAYAEGYNVFLCNTDEDPEREIAVLQSLEEKQVDGIILCSSRLDDRQLQMVLTRYPAVVLINRKLKDGSGPTTVSTVLLEDADGGRQATQHLLASGHRKVGFLAGPSASYSSNSRARGYQAALEGAGLAYRKDWIRTCLPYIEGGHKATLDLLAASPEITALFCFNDLVAVGALHAAAELGRRVPGDLAVVGFDDIPLAALVAPSLTTCRVPRYELGQRAVRSLLDRIQGCNDGCDELVLPVELIIRASAP